LEAFNRSREAIFEHREPQGKGQVGVGEVDGDGDEVGMGEQSSIQR
jgi:hypothetical protein